MTGSARAPLGSAAARGRGGRHRWRTRAKVGIALVSVVALATAAALGVSRGTADAGVSNVVRGLFTVTPVTSRSSSSRSRSPSVMPRPRLRRTRVARWSAPARSDPGLLPRSACGPSTAPATTWCRAGRSSRPPTCVPAADARRSSGRQSRRGRLPRPGPPGGPVVELRAEEGQRLRLGAARGQQPDRRPDVDNPAAVAAARFPVVPRATRAVPCTTDPTHGARRGFRRTARRRTRRCSSRT